MEIINVAKFKMFFSKAIVLFVLNIPLNNSPSLLKNKPATKFISNKKFIKLSRDSIFHSTLPNFRKSKMKSRSVRSSSDFININNSFNIGTVRFSNSIVQCRYFQNFRLIIFVIMFSVEGVIKLFSQNGAIPIATIPTIKIVAANFSFHDASVNCK
jgi:hypothetical protein